MAEITVQEMSLATKTLYEFEQRHAVGLVKKNFFGRVVVPFVAALLLHAEGVCKAVVVCFLSIKEMFVRSDRGQIERLKRECMVAFTMSFISMRSIFDQSVLSPRPTAAPLPKQPAVPQPLVENHIPAPALIPDPLPEIRMNIRSYIPNAPVNRTVDLYDPDLPKAPDCVSIGNSSWERFGDPDNQIGFCRYSSSQPKKPADKLVAAQTDSHVIVASASIFNGFSHVLIADILTVRNAGATAYDLVHFAKNQRDEDLFCVIMRKEKAKEIIKTFKKEEAFSSAAPAAISASKEEKTGPDEDPVEPTRESDRLSEFELFPDELLSVISSGSELGKTYIKVPQKAPTDETGHSTPPEELDLSPAASSEELVSAPGSARGSSKQG